MDYSQKQARTFSWQDLAVFLAITGVLALIAGAALHNSRQETRDIKRIADIKSIQHALELYYYDCYHYPSVVMSGKEISGKEDCQGNLYMQSVPMDPLGDSYLYVPCKDETVKECSSDLSSPGAYKLRYKLESKTDSISKGEHIAVPGNIAAQ